MKKIKLTQLFLFILIHCSLFGQNYSKSFSPSNSTFPARSGFWSGYVGNFKIMPGATVLLNNVSGYPSNSKISFFNHEFYGVWAVITDSQGRILVSKKVTSNNPGPNNTSGLAINSAVLLGDKIVFTGKEETIGSTLIAGQLDLTNFNLVSRAIDMQNTEGTSIVYLKNKTNLKNPNSIGVFGIVGQRSLAHIAGNYNRLVICYYDAQNNTLVDYCDYDMRSYNTSAVANEDEDKLLLTIDHHFIGGQTGVFCNISNSPRGVSVLEHDYTILTFPNHPSQYSYNLIGSSYQSNLFYNSLGDNNYTISQTGIPSTQFVSTDLRSSIVKEFVGIHLFEEYLWHHSWAVKPDSRYGGTTNINKPLIKKLTGEKYLLSFIFESDDPSFSSNRAIGYYKFTYNDFMNGTMPIKAKLVYDDNNNLDKLYFEGKYSDYSLLVYNNYASTSISTLEAPLPNDANVAHFQSTELSAIASDKCFEIIDLEVEQVCLQEWDRSFRVTRFNVPDKPIQSKTITDVSNLTYDCAEGLERYESRKRKMFVGSTTEAENKTAEISIFPQPSTNLVQIEINDGFELGKVLIYDIKGSQVMNLIITNDNESLFDVSELKSGIYIVKIETDKGFYTDKLIKH